MESKYSSLSVLPFGLLKQILPLISFLAHEYLKSLESNPASAFKKIPLSDIPAFSKVAVTTIGLMNLTYKMFRKIQLAKQIVGTCVYQSIGRNIKSC
ncbi:hypothetical protein [Aquimarina longa]|uniref:hypothetical protein n=1 Tax=Aquimarina longa TaxID=1080221 RepID=UPI000780A8BA|nr:hypothetical protein [Aquimarina longa]